MKERSLSSINSVIYHCSDSDNVVDDDVAAVKYLHTADSETPIKWGIYNTYGKNWDDIGYHFFIRKDGLIQTGRPLKFVGAHCRGHNSTSIGICFSGSKDFTKIQFISYLNLRSFILRQFGIDIVFEPHNKYSSKPCPGFKMEDKLREYGLLDCK